MPRLVEVSPKLVEVKDAPADLPEVNRDFVAGANAPGALRGLMSVAQGPSFGFADELAGAIGGSVKTALDSGLSLDFAKRVADFQKNYKTTRDYWRGAASEEEKEDPITTFATRALSAAPTWLFGGGPSQAATLTGRALQAGKVGAITGAVSGAGQSDAETPLGVALDTASSAATGGALGAAAVPVAAGMGSTYEAASGALSQSAAARYAREKVAEAFARDARGTVATGMAKMPSGLPDDAALALEKARARAPFTQASTRLAKLGDEARVVDAGGQNTRQLLDTVATLPGRSKEAVEGAIRSRQATRAGRLQGAAASGLSPQDARLLDTVDGLLAQRKQEAIPLYNELYKRGVFVNEGLQDLISRADALGAGGAAKKIATANGLDYQLASGTQWAPVRQLDYLKQGLDDIIKANMDDFGNVNKVGAAVQGLRKELIATLDDATGGLYAKARSAFAGPSQLIDAANAGRSIWSKDEQGIKMLTREMGDSELEAFRVGAFEALRGKLGNMGGQNEIMRMWRDKTTAEKLRAIFPDERAFRQFAAKVSKEGTMKGLESVGRGSQTAARQYGAGDLDVAALADTATAVSGMNSPTGFLSGAANLWNRVKTPEPVRDEMGRILLSQGQSGRQTIAQLDELMRQINESRMRQATGWGLLGGQQAAAPIAGLLVP